MGNTATTGKTRGFSLDQPIGTSREHSPRATDTMKTFDFPPASKPKTVLCYQSSLEYPSDENNEDFRVRALKVTDGWNVLISLTMPHMFRVVQGQLRLLIRVHRWTRIRYQPFSNGKVVGMVS